MNFNFSGRLRNLKILHTLILGLIFINNFNVHSNVLSNDRYTQINNETKYVLKYPVIISNTGSDNLNISNYLRDFINENKLEDDNFYIKRIENYTDNIYSSNENNELSFESLKSKANLTDYFIDYSKYSQSQGNSALIKFFYSESLITRKPRPITIVQPSNKSNVDYEIYQPEIYFNESKIYNNKHILNSNFSSVIFANLIIGRNLILSSGLKIFNITIEEIREIEIDSFFNSLSYIAYKNITKINSINGFLIIIDNLNDIYIINNRGSELELKLKLNDIRFNIFTLVNVNEKNNKLFFSFEEGILILEKEKDPIYVNYIDTLTNKLIYQGDFINYNNFSSAPKLNILNVQDINDAFYIAILNKGLIIIDVDLNIKFQLNHPYIRSIHSYKYNNKTRIGCIVDNNNIKNISLASASASVVATVGTVQTLSPPNEFYFDLNTDEVFQPKIFRIFLTPSQLDFSYLYNDSDYIYLYEKNFKSMYCIKKFSLDLEYSLNKFSLESISTRNLIQDPFTFMYNQSTFISYKTNDFVFITHPIKTNQAKIKINFYDEGEYEFNITTYDSNCQESTSKHKDTEITVGENIYDIDRNYNKFINYTDKLALNSCLREVNNQIRFFIFSLKSSQDKIIRDNYFVAIIIYALFNSLLGLVYFFNNQKVTKVVDENGVYNNHLQENEGDSTSERKPVEEVIEIST